MDDFILQNKRGRNFLAIKSFKESRLVVHAFSSKDIKTLDEMIDLLNIKPNFTVEPKQVHGDKVEEIKTEKGPLEADALITNKPGIVLSVRTADCVPIFILDSENKAIGLIHAGWKSSIAQIARKTIQKMENCYSTNPANCLIGIGPSIGRCCYEIGDEVVRKLKASIKTSESFLTKTPDGKWDLDLGLLNKEMLLEEGAREENFTISHLCTSCRKDLFYSYRRDGKTGRMFAILMLR
ncbi:MAG: peptidoglycan editing factor PgeF [Candidatus Saganbacteria bacterium]|nr:peptidoglycan editing factor PgeF [Candidatus Saganbacteria bacterium]